MKQQQANTTENPPRQPEKAAIKPSSPMRLILIGLLLASGLIWAGQHLFHTSQYETTDNAQIEGDIYPVISRIPGKVTDVIATDNARVNKGEVLIRLDTTDYAVRRDMAAASLQSAAASVESATSKAEAAQSAAQAAAATMKKMQADLRRNENLRRQEVISVAEFDGIRAGAQAAAAQYEAAINQHQAALAEIPLKKADMQMREAELRQAELQLSYTIITAPASGHVSKKNVQPGQYVTPGQPLIALVGSNALWVVANFKETQVEHIAIGQPVIIKVDAYPGKTFNGKVESLSSGTGAKFALLPPDNASGNFVKVTQRIPVKILFTDKANPGFPLAAGMNVVVEVKKK